MNRSFYDGVVEIFNCLNNTTRFRKTYIERLKNGVYRVDVELMYSVYVRFILDAHKRIENKILIGTFINKKFAAFIDRECPLDFTNYENEQEEVDKLAELFKDIQNEYRYRLKGLSEKYGRLKR